MGLGFKIEIKRVEKYLNFAKDGGFGRTCCLLWLLRGDSCYFECNSCDMAYRTCIKKMCEVCR